MATSKFFSSTFLACYSKLNPILFLRAVPAPFSLTATPHSLYYELVHYRPVRTPPSRRRRRKPNAHDDSDYSLPASPDAASAAAESTGLVEADMDRSKRKIYRKRQRRMYGGSDSDEDGRRGAGDDIVELKPEVIDFPRLHARKQEHYFYDAFAYPWEKEKHYRMVYQLEKKYFPQYSLEKAFVDPNAGPAASTEEGVGKKGRKSGKSKKEKDDGEERDERALVFIYEKDDEEKEENPADERVTEKKVEEFFKCLRKVPKAGNRPGDVVTADTEAPGEPYLVSRKTELPPRWDGPSGTVVLVDKPKVVVKTFTPEEVRDIAVELARLSGGIVLAIHEEDTIIMYRGKNYAQPPAEIMSPKVTLSRKKALDKSKYRDALRSLRIYIPKLHQDLEDLKERMKGEGETKSTITEEAVPIATENKETTNFQMKTYEGLDLQEDRNNDSVEDNSFIESSSWSKTEELSDIFETDSDADAVEKSERPLYLDELE